MRNGDLVEMRAVHAEFKRTALDAIWFVRCSPAPDQNLDIHAILPLAGDALSSCHVRMFFGQAPLRIPPKAAARSRAGSDVSIPLADNRSSFTAAETTVPAVLISVIRQQGCF